MSCFISYSSADAAVASALHAYLLEAGEEVFFAPRSNDARAFVGISEALEACSRFIYLSSRDYLQSEYCKYEWSAFLERCARDEERAIVGVQLDEADPPSLLTAWYFLGHREVGSRPAAETGWMAELLERIRRRRAVPAARLSREQIAALAESFARRVMDGPENVDLLTEPLGEASLRHRIREGTIFLKPEGTYNARCIEAVVERLLGERIRIVQARKYTGRRIRERGLFAKHYFGPVTFAQGEPPEFEPPELLRLQKFYFDPWQSFYGTDEDPSVDLILPALNLLAPPFGLTPDEISELWDRGREPHLYWNERPDGLNKIGYQKSVFPVRDPRIQGGRPRLLLNGYVPGYKKLLEEPADEVRVVCLRVATDRVWDEVRDDVLGGNSNPAKCKPTTLRRQAYENQAEFGIDARHVINGQQNLLHASATPLEGIHEIGLWFDVALDDTYLGAFLANRLGEDQLPDLFFRFPEFLTGARGKDIEELVREALEKVGPEEVKKVSGFADFKRETLARFARTFVAEFGPGPGDLEARLDAIPSIRHLVEVGYAVRLFGYKAIVEKFLPAIANPFFHEKCRQFTNLIAYVGREQLEEEPELIGLAVRVVCSDLLILSSSSYPDDFVDEFLSDLHQRAQDIARRTRANAMKQCAATLRDGAPPAGKPLGSLPVFARMREQRSGVIRINVGRGTPDLIAIITAGGRSTRVQSIIPKPVLKLDGKFLIDHVAQQIRDAYGPKCRIFVSLGWESDLLRACLGNQYRYLTLSQGRISRNRHLGLGPGARLFAALLQLEPYGGPILACYSDMPLVSAGSLTRLRAEFEEQRHALCLLTGYNAPLPGYVIRDRANRVLRVAHARYEPIAGEPERDVGFYMFRNTAAIRERLGAISNANVKREYGIHQLVESLAQSGGRIGTVRTDTEECWTVNNASDLFWLATGIHRDRVPEAAVRRDFAAFQRDYGVTFDFEWFRRERSLLRNLFNPMDRPDRPDVPLHFVTEFGP